MLKWHLESLFDIGGPHWQLDNGTQRAHAGTALVWIQQWVLPDTGAYRITAVFVRAMVQSLRRCVCSVVSLLFCCCGMFVVLYFCSECVPAQRSRHE